MERYGVRSLAKATGKSKGASHKASDARGQGSDADRRSCEVTGVILIAVGVLLGAYMFFSATGFLGKLVLTALFAICGVVAYALPLVFIGLGVLSIKGGSNVRLRGSVWLAVLAVLALVALMQLTRGLPYEGVDYMEYLNGARTAGADLRRGGGFIGGALCYPLQLLGGNVLAYTLLIAIIIIAVVTVTGLSIRDMSSKVGETVHTAVQSAQTAYEERAETNRKLETFDLCEDAPKSGGTKTRTKTAPAKQAKELPAKRVSKKKQKAMLDDVDELVSILDVAGHLPTKTGKAPKPFTPMRVTTDIWENLEPVVDVPPAIEPVYVHDAVPFDEAPLPDTSLVFGADAPVPESTGRKKPATAVVPKLTGAAAAKPIRVGKGAEPDPDCDIADIEFTNAPAYEPPPYTLLTAADAIYGKTGESPNAKGKLLIETLANFHIEAKIVNISVGPVLTRFEIQPAPGVRVNRITALSNDIALALAAQRVRIEAPIPGKSAVGIEIPNENSVTVVLRDIVESPEFQKSDSPVTMALGKDISGKTVVADLSKMPHMLIAGATGSGKSVCINDIIISMVYKSSPLDLKMVLIDPKVVELSVFSALPHLLIPVVTEPKKASGALRWAVNEMTQRYKKFAELGARDLKRYNEIMDEPERRLPKLVVIIDELADLMMVAPDEVEDSICRIAQLGRASGIHLIVATQRPSADIITGLIKANIPSRCAFAVSSGIDSRIILDTTGAEKLLGRGDMLFHPNGSNKPSRLQCAFVSDEEVERIVDFFRKRAKPPAFDEAALAGIDDSAEGGPSGGVYGEGKQEDDLLGPAVRVCLENGVASTSLLQRRLRVGYTRGSRLIDIMEENGFITPYEGSKPRKLLITKEQYAETFSDTLPFDDKGQGTA